MHVHVTIELDGDELVVVKTAAGDGAARLRREAERLATAAHPGVVALAGAGAVEIPVSMATGPLPGPGASAATATEPGFALRLAHAGEAVTRWSGPPSVVAGLAAAVASTLADLHDIGIVHGRLDASHVLVGDDGRPRLCGLSDPGAATAADDVAAWGRLVAELVERAPPPRRRGLARLGGRPDPRRALLAVADGAVDPVPERRPSARALADAVMTAVPDAALPTGPGRTRSGDDGEHAGGRPEGDTLDRIWSYAGEPTEDERWAAAFGAGPSDRGSTPPPDDDLPLAEVAALAWPAASGDHDSTDDVRHGDGATDTRSGAGAAALVTAPASDPWLVDADAVLAGLDPELDGAPDHAGAPLPGVGEGRPHRPASPHPVAPDDDRTRDHPPARRRQAAAGAVAEAPPTPGRRRRRVAVGVAVGLAVAGALAAVVLGPGSGGGADAPRAGAPSPSPGCAEVAAPAADVDGDGCREPLTVDGATVDAGVARWTLGEPGDVVTVGDWDCDGDASAALLRPATGDVFVFPTWAAVDEPVTVSPVRRVTGGVALRASADGATGCDHLVVDVPGSTPVPVEVGA